jgi:hypothetical protein
MIVYEVTASVWPDLCGTFEGYMLEHHIPDVMATGAFVKAAFERSGLGRYRVRYQASSQEILDRYIAQDAPRLRADVADRFPVGMELSRIEWTVLRRFT